MGAVLGVTRATIHEGDGFGWSERIGGLGGLSLGVVLSRGVSLHAEVEHLERGARDPAREFRMDSDYLEIPVYLRGVLSDSPVPGVRPAAILGAALAREYRCGGVVRPGQVALLGAPTPEIVSHDCSSMRSNRFDIGVLIGGGLEWSVGRSLMHAELQNSTAFSAAVTHYPPVAGRPWVLITVLEPGVVRQSVGRAVS